MCVNCTAARKKFWVFGCGAFFLLLSLLLGILWPIIATTIIQNKLELKEGSLNYNNWIETPIPMYLKITMFNWTNPGDIHNTSIKPHFVELGPYVFLEKHKRVNLSWHPENGTVSYDQVRTWHFVPELSNGSLSDEITNINVMTASAAYNIRHRNIIYKTLLNKVINEFGSFVITKSVRELLFDGYDDKILDIIKKIQPVPFNKFGWFVDRNNSQTYDGHFEITTGQQDISQMGKLTQWNYKTHTPYFHGECSEIKGTSGELWPGNMNATADITFFVSDICRSLTLKYDQPHVRFNVEGSRWIADYRVFDNGEKYPPNACYCTGEKSSCPDLLYGVQNMSDCRYGAPAFASFPHFYLADPAYANAVSGLKPNKSLHEFSLSLEPHTGIPLDIDAKLQINILIQDIPHITLYEKLPKIMIPVFWFQQTVQLNEELAKEAKMAVQLPYIGTYTAYGFFGLSSILVVVGIIATYTRSWNSYAHLDDELNS